jgi:hypothetical protein
MARKPEASGRGAPSSQVVDLLLHVLGTLGITGDQEIAELVGVSREQVKNWKKGLARTSS